LRKIIPLISRLRQANYDLPITNYKEYGKPVVPDGQNDRAVNLNSRHSAELILIKRVLTSE